MDKLTIDELKDILMDITTEPVALVNLTGATLLCQDLGMDEADMTEMSIEIGDLLDIHIPTTTWSDWYDNMSTLTVQQVIDDSNNLL